MMAPACGVHVELHSGDRDELMPLFSLADDSPSAILAYRDRGTLLVARDGETILGHALVIDEGVPDCAELKSLAVGAEYQGRGIGSRLVRAVVDEVRRRGIDRLETSTATADIRNLRFYQLNGFRMLRVERDAFNAETGHHGAISEDGIEVRDRIVFDLPVADQG